MRDSDILDMLDLATKHISKAKISLYVDEAIFQKEVVLARGFVESVFKDLKNRTEKQEPGTPASLQITTEIFTEDRKENE